MNKFEMLTTSVIAAHARPLAQCRQAELLAMQQAIALWQCAIVDLFLSN